MTKSFKFWLCVAALTVFGFISVVYWPISTPAIAQQPPPNGNPPPGPAETCCELLTPGGNTIGGPGVVQFFPADRISDTNFDTFFLAIGRPQDACITISNTGSLTLRLFMTDRAHDVWGAIVNPGKTKTLCVSNTILAKAHCDSPPGPDCSYRWRVDKPL